MSGALRVLKTAASTADNFSGPFKALKSIGKGSSALTLLKNMDFAKISKSFGSATSLTNTTSAIADTAGTLKSFSNAIPSSTDNILGSLSDSVKATSDTVSSSLKNIASPGLLKNAANTNSLSRLKQVSLSITSATSTTSSAGKNLARRSTKVISKADNFKAVAKSIPPVNKVDDVAGALKKSKGVIGRLDDAGDVGKSVAKNADEAADGANVIKKGKKAVTFIDKHGSKIQALVMGYYFQGVARNIMKQRSESKEDGGFTGVGWVCEGTNCPDDLADDPGTETYEVEKFVDAKIVTGEQPTLTDTLFTKEIIIGTAIVSILIVVV